MLVEIDGMIAAAAIPFDYFSRDAHMVFKLVCGHVSGGREGVVRCIVSTPRTRGRGTDGLLYQP